MKDLFVTGMLRSGTTLVQVLLTNHPDALVAYQPFSQLYVDTKAQFLEEQGIERLLPISDDMDDVDEVERFHQWLAGRQFTHEEANELACRAPTGKGGGAPDLADRLRAQAGTFFDIRRSLHDQLVEHLAPGSLVTHVGSKEVLCEEYVAPLLERGGRCVLVIRDPRAVVASASHGRYRQQVGDRYPLLMLIRLWRKSAAHWLELRHHDRVAAVRYEDIATSPGPTLEKLAQTLDLGPFPPDMSSADLRDHAGRPWTGNSSFGRKVGVDDSSLDTWRSRLSAEEAAFVEACTWHELEALAYPRTLEAGQLEDVITTFREDEQDVRPSYLDLYRIGGRNRERERRRALREGG